MKPKVLITKNIPDYVEEYIGRYCDYEIADGAGYNEIINKIQDVDGLAAENLVKALIGEVPPNVVPELR